MDNSNVRKIFKILKYFFIVVILLIFDQSTKALAITYLKDGKEISVIKDVFVLYYLENRGAAFGMFQGKFFLFIISFIILLAIVIIFFRRVPMEKHFMPLRICVITIFAGAIGNFVDRVRLGYVVDFFYFKLIDFPIFNVADIYVTCSTIVLILLIIFYYKEEDFERIFSRRK
ncbi:MAG: signal peptidase II [Suipraeoptans sp.]